MDDARYVSVRLAADGLQRPARTIRAWITTGAVRHVKAADGAVFVYAPDLPAVHATRGRRRRLATHRIAK